MWLNGLYDALVVTVLFPLILLSGASAVPSSTVTEKRLTFLGDLSYPLYMVHYPVMYLFYAYLWDNGLTFSDSWILALGVVALNIFLGYLALHLYDLPVRKWLSRRDI